MLVLMLILYTVSASANSVQISNTIYIADRHNLAEVYNDIANDSALSYDGSGNCLLNAYLINNNTANRFYMNSTDSLCFNHLRINSTHVGANATYWYYLTNGQTEIENYKITSWNVTKNNVETLPISTWQRAYIYASGSASKMNISFSNVSYLGYLSSAQQSGVYYITSSYNRIINSVFLQNQKGFYLGTNSNNNYLDSNSIVTISDTALFLETSSNNTLVNNTANSTDNYGIYIYVSSYNNTLINNTAISKTFIAAKIYSSSYNNFISNNFTSAGISDIMLQTADRTNYFIDTNFSTPKKIWIFALNNDEFNQSQDSGTSFVSLNLSVGRTLTRSIINWNQTNITFNETFSGATTGKYSATGLFPYAKYQVWNNSVVDYDLTTNMYGVLDIFTINFTTSQRTIKIIYNGSLVDTSFTVSLPSGITQAYFNATTKSSKNVNASGQNLTVGFLYITNTGNVAEDFYAIINSSQPAGVALKGSTDNNPAGESVVPIDDSLTKIIDAIPVSESQYFWLWVDYSNALPMTEQRILSVNSSQI